MKICFEPLLEADYVLRGAGIPFVIYPLDSPGGRPRPGEDAGALLHDAHQVDLSPHDRLDAQTRPSVTST
jgi:hypothetical protein